MLSSNNTVFLSFTPFILHLCCFFSYNFMFQSPLSPGFEVGTKAIWTKNVLSPPFANQHYNIRVTLDNYLYWLEEHNQLRIQPVELQKAHRFVYESERMGWELAACTVRTHFTHTNMTLELCPDTRYKRAMQTEVTIPIYTSFCWRSKA